MSIDDRYPSPRTFLRHAVGLDAPAPSPPSDPQPALSAAARGSGNTDIGELTAGDLQLLEVRRELQQARDRMRHLEQALKAAGRVLQPYLGNGRP